MPRKAFVADLQEAIDVGPSVAKNLFDLQSGDEDGSFRFKYEPPEGGSPTVKVEAQVTEVGDYPVTHGYFIYTASENVPRSISEAFEDFSIFDGMKVSPMLCKVARVLNNATTGSRVRLLHLDEDTMDVDSVPEPESEENDGSEEEDESLGYDDEGGYSPQSPQYDISNTARHGDSSSAHARTTFEFNSRIRADLRLVKSAGFRIGYLGNLLNNGQDSFVTIACRISKLGIPDEALQAWHLDRNLYLVLLIHYTAGYRTMDRLNEDDLSHGSLPIQMRVGTSKRYKVSLTEALNAFTQIKEKAERKSESEKTDEDKISVTETGLHNLFISRPLNELLNQRLLPILRNRLALGLPWSGAEACYNDNQGKHISKSDSVEDKYFAADDSEFTHHLPKLVTSDHLTELHRGTTSNVSFPLLAMQFTLRHLVRCTEFCLVCHCRVEADFEALKPYVCSRPLCLWQYMALGFGPSIEHEILTQPDVVDLLVSFCYSSASSRKLKDLPIGMGLTVPLPSLLKANWITESYSRMYSVKSAPQLEPAQEKSVNAKRYTAKYDQRTSEMIFKSGETPLRTGDWIVSTVPGTNAEYQHRRVVETLYPTVRLGPPIPKASTITPKQSQHTPSVGTHVSNTLTPATTPPLTGNANFSSCLDIEFAIYDQHFDDLPETEKLNGICLLLNTLPSVSEMKGFLQDASGKQLSLRQWPDRVSASALGLLRWIIASNRSCIVQSDTVEGSLIRPEERVTGMPSYVQFRFAQGAPDKEQRFIIAVRETAARLGLKYPTIFAWHGSPLGNWHSIVREGLHFKEWAHGRAYGDGVYHSLDATTSLGYTGYYPQPAGYSDTTGLRGWPQSHLNITQALSLNEIVNAPEEFVSKSPHLVVKQLDWIQTRYLFVKCNGPEIDTKEKRPSQIFDQDPSYHPVGPTRQSIIIPITAVSKSRRPGSKGVKSGNKKSKVISPEQYVDDVLLSDQTDIEDVEVLFSDDEKIVDRTVTSQETGKSKSFNSSAGENLLDRLKTDFTPGTLDLAKLPILEPPTYATSQATKILQRELRATLGVQETHLVHELGWSIDPEFVSNVYQWIVELHSFEENLPLAIDMKDRGLKSIILELRFAHTYPYSPPFVRIIRPRFLPFLQGGGGHVTSGGALCMELLTNTGWSSATNIESVLFQVRLAISSRDPQPARLERGSVRDYDAREAIDAYKRACAAHGWEVPAELKSFIPGSTNRSYS